MWRFPSLTETWIERAEQVLNDSSSVFLTDEDLLDEINEWLDEKYQFSQRTFQRYKSWETTWQDYEKDLFDSFRHLYKKALRREKKNLCVKFQSDEWQWQKWAWIIERKFDEIVAFSEIEKFLDTPVKRYSSGMYVRLAFGVAAHLEPEILIVDEVLAVGDAAFQKKCLGKMQEISGDGKTILFVSHNMAAIQNLCNKGMVLKNGKMDLNVSDAQTAIKHYMRESATLGRSRLNSRADREGEGLIRFEHIALFDSGGQELNGVHSGQEVNFRIETQLKDTGIGNVGLAMTFYSEDGIEMMTLANHISGQAFDTVQKGDVINCYLKKFPLTRGEYVVNVSLYKDGILQDYIREGFSLTVHEGDYYGTGRILPGTQPTVLVDHQRPKSRRTTHFL